MKNFCFLAAYFSYLLAASLRAMDDDSSERELGDLVGQFGPSRVKTIDGEPVVRREPPKERNKKRKKAEPFEDVACFLCGQVHTVEAPEQVTCFFCGKVHSIQKETTE